MPKKFSSSARARPPRGRGLLAGLGFLAWLDAGGQAAPESAQPAAESAAFDLLAPLGNDGPIGYFIGDASADAGARDGDAELCEWALADWVRNAEGRLAVEPAAEAEALVRIHFVAPGFGQYGEMRPIRVGDRRGAIVYVRPDTGALGPEIAIAAREDPLLREAIVYLTCLHELGHALGLEHTAEFADVMYFFGYGGDVPAFFGRYRARLESRDDISRRSGLSAGDIVQLLAIYPAD